MISSVRSDNLHTLLMIIPMTSLESCDDIQGRWWYPQKTVAICAENIGSVFWGNISSPDFVADVLQQNWSLISIFHCISELLDSYQTILETPRNLLRNPKIFRTSLQNFLRNRPDFFWESSELSEGPQISEDPQFFFMRIVILRIFWRSSSSEFSEDPHPQNFLGILIIFWRSSSSEFSEDRRPQNFLEIVILRIFWGPAEIPLNKSYFCLKIDLCLAHVQKKRLLSEILQILRKFWGWGSQENSEDDDPQKIPRVRIHRKFWGWGSSEFAVDDDPQKILRWRSSENAEDFQKILRMRILRKFWGCGSSENSEDEDPQEILRMRILRKLWVLQKMLRSHQEILRILSNLLIIIRKLW